MEELVTEALEANDLDAAFDCLMTEYGQDILQLVYSYVQNYAIAEDLTQEIFVKCYFGLPTFQFKSKIRTWLWSIAIHHCKDYLRSWHHRHIQLTYDQLEETSSDPTNVEKIVLKREEDEELIKSIFTLPIKHRELIYLFYLEEMSIKEISSLLGVNSNTIKTRLRRALSLLKKELEE